MISYDTNVLIYAFESDNQWSAAARKIVEVGEREGAVLSVLAWQEILAGAALRSTEAEAKQRAILDQFMITRFVPVTEAIANKAVALTRRFGRKAKGYDAILLATAIEQGADTFWTNDKILLELKLPNLNIRSL